MEEPCFSMALKTMYSVRYYMDGKTPKNIFN